MPLERSTNEASAKGQDARRQENFDRSVLADTRGSKFSDNEADRPFAEASNTEARTDLAYAVISSEHLPLVVLQRLFTQIHSAATDRELLDCLVLLSENDVNIISTIEALNSQSSTEGRREILINILFELLDKFPPAMMQIFLATASEIKDIRGLIRLLVLLKQHGINPATLSSNLSGIFDGHEATSPAPTPVAAAQPTAIGDNPPGAESPPDSATEEPFSAGELAFLHLLTSEADGMKAPKGNGEFKTSPQKDLAREIWGDRVRARFGKMDEAGRGRLRAFSLLGEGAGDLSIYENLGIPRDHIHAAEFSPAVYAKMTARFPGLMVFSGNCHAFYEAARTRKVDINGGFDVMNLDIYGTVGEFFSSGDAQSLWLLKHNSELCINARVRQDASDLDEAHLLVTALSTNFPELKEYLEKLKEAKQNLFPDEAVALNMALRDFYTAFKLAMSLPSTESLCRDCKKVIQDSERQLNSVRIAGGRYMSDPEYVRSIGHHPLALYVHLFELTQNEKVLDAAGQLPPQSFDAIARRAKQASRKLKTNGNRGMDNTDMMSLIRKMEADYLENDEAEEAQPFTEEEIKYLKIFIDYFFLLQWGPLIRRYSAMAPTSVKRVTYTHDSNHTFESWMLSMERVKTPTTVMLALKTILDQMLNSEDTFIDGKCQVHTYKPAQKTKIKIPPERLLDAHQLPCGHKRRRLSPKEVAKRRSKREMARISRKLNRRKER